MRKYRDFSGIRVFFALFLSLFRHFSVILLSVVRQFFVRLTAEGVGCILVSAKERLIQGIDRFFVLDCPPFGWSWEGFFDGFFLPLSSDF